VAGNARGGHLSLHGLVTGGAGFIGSQLCGELLDRGPDVTLLDDLSTGSMANISRLKSILASSGKRRRSQLNQVFRNRNGRE